MSLLSCACTTSKSFLLSWCHLQAHPHQCPRGDGSCQQRGPGEMRDDGKAEGTRGAQRSALQTALRVRTGENHRAWAEAWSCYKTTAQAALEWKQKIHIKSIRNEFGQQEWKKEFLGLCLGWLMLPGLPWWFCTVPRLGQKWHKVFTWITASSVPVWATLINTTWIFGPGLVFSGDKWSGFRALSGNEFLRVLLWSLAMWNDAGCFFSLSCF